VLVPEVQLTELLVALSLATDLGLGQPAEHMLRSARISMRLGERLGLDDAELATLYDVSILTYVGCPVYGNEAAAMFGDDIDFRADFAEVDRAGFSAMIFMLRHAGAGTSPIDRVSKAVQVMADRGVVAQMANHCSAAGELADRLGLPVDVRAGVEQSYTRWDGRGVPDTLAGDKITLSARIAHVAEACEVFHRIGGIERALEMVRSRSGTHFDPEVAAAAQRDAHALFHGLDDAVEGVLDAAPVTRPPLSDEELDSGLEAIGDFSDLRSPHFAGHSRGTADLVHAAATGMSLPPEIVKLTRRAAWIHDIGRSGVSSLVWDKPGPLTPDENERMRMHVYYGERIFRRLKPLREIGELAATHHERLDGSGYHRGIGGSMLTMPSRLLAVADAYHAMTQNRPHRDAMTEPDAARQLRQEANDGYLDPLATDAVLTAAGQTTGRRRSSGPAGLTAREIEVLALLTHGLPNKTIAFKLGISRNTVGNHVERIYTKLGVSSRAAAAMRAMQHGIVGQGQEESAGNRVA
jgi:HD-GYP domain-containing protein (c-di-GMP phosphodiesterase class II)